MFGRKNPEVLVVGAGPVGLFAALLLARRGVRLEIIDRDWRTGAHSYALALHPRSLRLFDELGLKEAVLQEAYPITSIGFYGGGERRAEIRAGGNSAQGLLAAVLRQDALEALLEKPMAQICEDMALPDDIRQLFEPSECVEAGIAKRCLNVAIAWQRGEKVAAEHCATAGLLTGSDLGRIYLESVRWVQEGLDG